MKCAFCFLRVVAGLAFMVGVATICGCATPAAKGHRTDPDIARAANAARLAFERGSVLQAERLYERALRLARAQDDARECGTLAYNLAVCLAEQGRLDETLTVLGEARADYERLGRSQNEILLLEADIARRQRRYDEALTILDRLEDIKVEKRKELEYVALAKVIRAKMAADRGETSQAASYAEQARALLKKGAVATELRAEMERTEAVIAQAEGRWSDSAAAYDREAAIWRGARQFRRMAVAMGWAAHAYRQTGALEQALDRFYWAARSLAAQGDDIAALKLIESALDVADQRPDADKAKLLASLFQQIKARAIKP